MRNRIRIFWLWLKHEFEIASSFCQRCGTRGAAVTSLVFPKRLCKSCAYEVTKHIGKAPAMFGGEESIRNSESTATPAWVLAENAAREERNRARVKPLLIEEEDNIPCFDTYPASPPDAWWNGWECTIKKEDLPEGIQPHT